ncbi:AraC family transcriptional regulator [Labrenzia sp. PHM005]|uniref:AraC family transcriptional regulator n=1 Tax=Labrenzia sp. PHM005 TaxID=2590016 RepID=UPI00114072D6|nr:AraC family transcriptional regulator [Labrenzia sp. PHM005]QDG78764.1 AraC family transcriptional regulator [Labrenzia sp. PHM005]
MTSLYAGMVSNLMSGYQEAGFDLADALRAAKFDRISPEATVQDFVRLSRAVSLLMNDEYAGQMERAQRVGTLALLAAHVSHGRTLGDGFQRLSDFMNMLDNTFTVSFFTNGAECRFQLKRINPKFPRSEFGVEAVLILMHRLLEWMSASSLPVNSIWFDYTRPDWAGSYSLLFPNAEPAFAASTSGFSIPLDELSRPLCRAEIAAKAWARRTPMDAFFPVEHYLGTSLEISSLLENAIKESRKLPSMEDLAEHLEMPVYTLRRRLKKEGCALPAIRLQVKRDHACRLLAETDQSVESISAQLGFSETSAFVRAFKDWIGVTPRTYRQAGLPQVIASAHRTFN